MDSPFVGPSYNLDSRPASVQRTVNLMPVPIEPGNERAGWVFRDVPGLIAVSQTVVVPPEPPAPETAHVCDDGPTWSARTQPSDRYSGLAYGQTRFVATGHGQGGTTPTRTMYSLDKGQTWTDGGSITNYFNYTPIGLRFGNGLFLCVMTGGATPVSADGGESWTSRAGTGIFNISSVEFGNGLFLVVSSSAATLVSSADGNVWTSHTLPEIFTRCFWDSTRSRWLGIADTTAHTFTSPDLVTWTQRGDMPVVGTAITLDNMAQATSGTYAGTIICAFNDGTLSTIYTDDGGVTWGSSSALVTNQVVNAIFGNGIFMITKALGGQTNVSRDGGRTWLTGNSLTTTLTWFLAYNGLNSYTAVGGAGSDGVIANVGDC